MTNQERPDCGVDVGEPHKNECDIERCSKCGGQRISCECDHHEQESTIWTGEWPSADEKATAGQAVDQVEEAFVIYWHLDRGKVKPPPPAPPPPAPVRHYSDDFRSANARIEWKTHIAEAIFKDGKPTGEWRVARGQFFIGQMGNAVPWEAVLPNREAAFAWVPSGGKKEAGE